MRYRYVDAPVKASALIVRDELFLSDAKKASLGEFVSGRLLNVHLPLLNAEFTREAEVESKKRVIAEAIYELSSQNGEFSQDLIIPLDYFLFDKLHKRAMIYPPVLYSYIKTYTCPSAPREQGVSSLDGFREAAKLLASQGFFELHGDRVRLVSEKLKGKSFARLLALFNLTKRGVRQYAVHGYAGQGRALCRQGRGPLEGEADAAEDRASAGAPPAQGAAQVLRRAWSWRRPADMVQVLACRGRAIEVHQPGRRTSVKSTRLQSSSP